MGLFINGREVDDQTLSKMASFTATAAMAVIDSQANRATADAITINYTPGGNPAVPTSPILDLTLAALVGYKNAGVVAAVELAPVFIDTSVQAYTIGGADDTSVGVTLVIANPAWGSFDVTIANNYDQTVDVTHRFYLPEHEDILLIPGTAAAFQKRAGGWELVGFTGFAP